MNSYQRNTQIDIISVSDDKLSFVLYNSDLSFANALRRVLIAEVPTMAIDVVNIEVNTSPLPDYVLAHRLGLIPLYCDNIDDYKFTNECPCESGCPNCSIPFKLEVYGERKQEGDQIKPTNVTSDDLIIDDSRIQVAELAESEKKNLNKFSLLNLKV